MALKLYNSLTREREAFRPLDPPRVRVYVCGPTVYGHSHLGHAKSYVSFDAILRWLRASGWDVNYVQNITDVGHLTDDADAGEDKIVVEARRRGLHPMAVVESFMRSYYEDMDALGVLRPDIAPRATGHITEQIEQIRVLIERGHAYEVNGSVYFDVSSYASYGRLSGRTVEDLEAGARVAVNEEKRHPADFALWKRAETGHIMRWPSPWGEGFPGWHIECSAMSQKYLGETFDIHGGGNENKFPHHECEIAQAECATGRPFARVWLHNNMCTINGQKMGKSLGNSVLLKDVFHTDRPLRDREGALLLERAFEPVVVRHFILTSHYRQPLDFSNDALRAAESGSYRLRDALNELSRAIVAKGRLAQSATPSAAPVASEALPPGDAGARLAAIAALAPSEGLRATLAKSAERFVEAMDEDFNTAAAIASLFDLARTATECVKADGPLDDLAAIERLMRRLAGDVLGFSWRPAGGQGDGARDGLIQLLVDLRNEARLARNFALSDQIRNRLAALGVQLKDGPSGTTW